MCLHDDQVRSAESAVKARPAMAITLSSQAISLSISLRVCSQSTRRSAICGSWSPISGSSSGQVNLVPS